MLRLTFYRSDGWRWRLTARNGRVVGASTEAFSRLADCRRNAAQVTGYRRRPLVRVRIAGRADG